MQELLRHPRIIVGRSGVLWWKGGGEMFLGQHEHSMDEKGRLFLPAKFRERLGSPFVVTKGLDNCLFVYPLLEWEATVQRLQEITTSRGDARAFERLFLSGAAELDCDKQGRINIPEPLRQHSRLEKDAVVIGVGRKIEVWSKQVWQEYSNKSLDNYEQIAEQLEVRL